MNILALDCGTKTGWAVARDGKLVESGVSVFELKRGDKGMRFFRFRSWLEDLVKMSKPDVIYYEQAHYRGGAATALGVGMATRVQEVASVAGISYASVHTGTLKKHATGRGNSAKPMMIAAAKERWRVEPEDDNEADALCILAYAIDDIG